jgi:hypothetical protein
MKPKRIQRKRTKGWKMPPNTVYVGRPTKWGNPIFSNCTDVVELYKKAVNGTLEEWNRCYAIKCSEPKQFETIKKIILRDPKTLNELHGKNLACWCPLDKPCHADILLEIANNS